MRKLIISAVLLSTSISPAQAGQVDDNTAVKCILGEVRGDYTEFKDINVFVALAEALRTRGTTKGVYGCTAYINEDDRLFMERRKYADIALEAWRESELTNLTRGAQYWGSTVLDKGWINAMERAGYVKTYEIGHTAYYRK